MKVFVYGTLMKGLRNHIYIKNQRLIGKAFLTGYEMYNIRWFPGIVKSESVSQPIIGELYEIDTNCLAVLDRLEGEGHLYKRVEEKVTTEDGQVHTAYVYVWLGGVHSCQIVKKTPWEPRSCMGL